MRATYAEVRRAVPEVTARLAAGDVVVVLSAPGPVDLRLLDVLARLVLRARRCGRGLAFLVDSPDAQQLCRLAGLTGVLPLRQVRRQTEPAEQPGAEEVVDVGDAPA